MGLFLLLTWVVFTLFGVNLTLKVEYKFKVQDDSFFGVILTPQYLGSLLLLKKSSFYSQSGVKITPKWGYLYSLHGLFLLFLELI